MPGSLGLHDISAGQKAETAISRRNRDGQMTLKKRAPFEFACRQRAASK
jgi:hypothetical protein